MKYFAPTAAVLLLGAVQTAPAWTPAPTLAAKLAPAVKEAGYQVRPPRGYTESPADSGKYVDWIWTGPDQPDKYVVFLTLSMSESTPSEPKKTLPQELASMMGVEKDKYANFKATPAQKGTIHGVPFLRCYWTGTDKEHGRKMKGFQYVGQSSGITYDLSANGSASYSKSQFDLAEASVLTLRKL